LVPTLGGQLHHFNNVGLYDALFVMQDTESKTLWNHITGEALYGPLVGRTLGPVGNLLQMNVQAALQLDPGMQVAISNRPYFVGDRLLGAAPGAPTGPRRDTLSEDAQLMPMFIETLGKEDTRRPRMDMGLGIWSATGRRYYPMQLIRADRALIDRFDGREVLVYIDPETATPAALFVNARQATVQGQEVRLDTGTVVRAGALFDPGGARREAERPQQIFTRWYGFALTFPGAEVYGQ
jgi:Protein of unknown function (DUF3179)